MARLLFISGHDYRTKRKANIHFICRAAAKEHEVTFYSTGYSWVSDLIGRDPRLGNELTPNCTEMYDGVRCYLDRRKIHPGGLGGRVPSCLTDLLFQAYIARTPTEFVKFVQQADFIFVESGIACAYFDYIFELNPAARVIYIASDDLRTLNASNYLVEMLRRNVPRLHRIRLPSRKMTRNFVPDSGNIYYVPHGIEKPETNPNSPYQTVLNAVCVGSMLFDPTFFEIAAPAFPELTFHLIGCGSRHRFPAKNIITYPEMNHGCTLGYIIHATIGIAPYREAAVPYYLSDTSMKLLQYDTYGLVSVCPYFATDSQKPWRIPYQPGNAESIIEAVGRALNSKVKPHQQGMLTWDEVFQRIMHPELHKDTKISEYEDAYGAYRKNV
jgi:2-beta-glucuronyltransferase